MKRALLLTSIFLISAAIVYFSYSYFAQPDPDQLPIPEQTDSLAWNILQNATYTVPHVDGGTVTLKNGQAEVTVKNQPATIQIANTRAYGFLNEDWYTDAAISLITIQENQPTRFDLVAAFGDGSSVVSNYSTIIDTNIYSGTLSIADDTITAEYIVPEDDYHTPASLITKTYAVRHSDEATTSEESNTEDPSQVLRVDQDDARLVLISTQEDGIEAQSLIKDNPPKTVTLSNNQYKDTASISKGRIQPYTFTATQGDQVDITLDSTHDDALLSIFANDDQSIILSITDQQRSVSGTVPSTQSYTILVVPTSNNDTKYTLTIAQTPQSTSAPQPTSAPSAPTSPPATGDKTIYFTFDDGPWGSTTDIVNILNQYDARATFFVIGRQVDSYAAGVQAVTANGSTFANHTWDHATMTGMSQTQFNQEITDTQNVLPGQMTNCLRPPGGAMDSFSRAYAQELGYQMVLWDIDTRDWSRPGVQSIVDSVLTTAAPGKIVLMHDGGGDRSQTIQALPQILQTLSSQGYTFVPYCTKVI